MAKNDFGGILLIIGLVAVILLVKLIMVIWPYLIGIFLLWIGYGIYSHWKVRMLKKYDNDWKLIYENELKVWARIAMVVVPVSMGFGINELSKRIAYENEINRQRQEQLEKSRIEEKERKLAIQLKKDSSNHFLALGLKDIERKRYKSSIINLDSALIIYPNNHEAHYQKCVALKKRRKYNSALKEVNKLIKKTSWRKDKVLLLKGQCLLKLGRKEEAVISFYGSAKRNSIEAGQLYEKYNPYMKVVSYYTTLCCDGTHSTATGRGACSHHGGVCNWRYPIYKNRRKYEISD